MRRKSLRYKKKTRKVGGSRRREVVNLENTIDEYHKEQLLKKKINESVERLKKMPPYQGNINNSNNNISKKKNNKTSNGNKNTTLTLNQASKKLLKSTANFIKNTRRK